jgi:hypothetical protein
LVLRSISRLLDLTYRGIAFQAVALTFGMVVLYRTRIISSGPKVHAPASPAGFWSSAFKLTYL